jgi:hypothetical protein
MSTRKKKELLHPIFLECKKHVVNPFWKSLFEEFAYGKYPKQLYITQSQNIQSTSRTQSFHYSFADKPIEQIIPDIQELLMTHTNLISDEEVELKKSDHLKFKQDAWVNWKDIKKKYVRDILIMEYCMSLRHLKFTQEQCSNAYKKILLYTVYYPELLGFHLEEGRISRINGITINTEQLTIEYPPIEPKPELLYEVPDMITNYCKRTLLRTSKFINEFNEK